jgi:hypothetical protein
VLVLNRASIKEEFIIQQMQMHPGDNPYIVGDGFFEKARNLLKSGQEKIKKKFENMQNHKAPEVTPSPVQPADPKASEPAEDVPATPAAPPMSTDESNKKTTTAAGVHACPYLVDFY